MTAFDVDAVRARFPAVAGSPIALLDNAAATCVPRDVIDALTGFYTDVASNVHRSVHARGRAATDAYEGARAKAAAFLGGGRPEELVFTRNATDAINLVARGFVEPRINPGEEIVVTALEHHSNLVPWQELCRRTGARLRIVGVDAEGCPSPGDEPIVTSWTRLVATTHVSNAIGAIVPLETLVGPALEANVPVLVDVNQSAAHLPSSDILHSIDFIVCSSHKIYGPMGVGMLRARRLPEMIPIGFGGEMVEHVSARSATYQPGPHGFEPGTPDVAGAIALPAAIEWIGEVGLDAIRAHELELLGRLVDGLERLEHVRVVGPADLDRRSGVVSFVIDGGDPVAAATLLDLEQIAVRAGFHCAEPLLAEALGCGPTVRASVAAYTSADDVDRLLEALPGIVEDVRG